MSASAENSDQSQSRPRPGRIPDLERTVIDAIESGQSKGDVTIEDEDGNILEPPVYSSIPDEVLRKRSQA